jgi:hypothetical protein
MQYWLTSNPWYGVICWVILYISDYYLTIKSARGFREIDRYRFEGSMELTPQFQKDVDHLRPISKRHIIWLVASSLILLIVWWITRLSIYLEWTYPLYLGMFLLLEVAVHLRHLRNIAIIREIQKNGGVDGQITYKQWFSYQNSANELYITGTFFLLVAVLTFSLFFLGGAIACYGTGIRHAKLAKKVKSNPAKRVELEA